jgi:hypothetical protein
MKRIVTSVAAFVLLALTFGLSPSSVLAQARPSSKTNVLSLKVLGAIRNYPTEINYEWKADSKSSWLARLEYWNLSDLYTGFGLGAQYRFYIADSRALTGLSIGPEAEIFFLSPSNSAYKSYTIVAIGGDIAYKWIFTDFAVEPFLGVRFGIGGSEGVKGTTGPDWRLGLNLGYAW